MFSDHRWCTVQQFRRLVLTWSCSLWNDRRTTAFWWLRRGRNVPTNLYQWTEISESYSGRCSKLYKAGMILDKPLFFLLQKRQISWILFAYLFSVKLVLEPSCCTPNNIRTHCGRHAKVVVPLSLAVNNAINGLSGLVCLILRAKVKSNCNYNSTMSTVIVPDSDSWRSSVHVQSSPSIATFRQRLKEIPVSAVISRHHYLTLLTVLSWTLRLLSIGAGTGGAGGAVAPPTKLLGEQLVHPAPHFFCNSQLKRNFTDCKVTFNTKIFENSPSFWGKPQTSLCTAYAVLKNTYCIKSNFEFDCLDCFSPIFASPKEKSFNFCAQPKNRSRAYVAIVILPMLKISDWLIDLLQVKGVNCKL